MVFAGYRIVKRDGSFTTTEAEPVFPSASELAGDHLNARELGVTSVRRSRSTS